MVSFKQFLTEVYAAGGFAYEDQIADILKAKKMMDPNAKTAGSSGSAADATIKGYSLEVKKDKSAMFGQAELVFKNNKWDFSDRTKKSYPATVKKLISSGVLKEVASKWGKPTGRYETDLKKMGNLYISVAPDTIAAHYAQDRKTPYIQIGNGYGLYKFAAADPAKLNVPIFKVNVKARARVKYRSKGSYGFLIVLMVDGALKPSPTNIETF
jgi:hypothetical protein